ncbi:hypothetical protein CK218_12820 [Mesorhizobium sp. WSM3879]|nr:hypothetical protein CK218_12820 [Mesorhizobium sp. WSM3879]
MAPTVDERDHDIALMLISSEGGGELINLARVIEPALIVEFQDGQVISPLDMPLNSIAAPDGAIGYAKFSEEAVEEIHSVHLQSVAVGRHRR